MFERMKGAAMLDVDTFEEVEHDLTATGQAGMVVFLGAIASGIGASDTSLYQAFLQSGWTVIGWGIWAGITYLIGANLFGGTADWGELLRTLGFAHAPYLLLVLGAVPLVPDNLLTAVVGIWVLIAGVVAVRQALDFSTGKALATVGLGWATIMLGIVFLAGSAAVLLRAFGAT
jgi:hypothetical protein